MSGNPDQSYYGRRENQYGGRDRRDDRDRQRQRSRSPRRDTGSSQGGRNFHPSQGRGRGDGHGRGTYQEDNREQNRSRLPNIPPLPKSAPFPEGTGAKVPYTDIVPRGTIGTKALFFSNHFSIETLPIIRIFQYDLRFRVPESSQARGDEKVTANQMARILVNATLVDFLGPDFVFDGVSLGWSPTEIIPVGNFHSTTISLGDRPNGKPNEVDIEVHNVGLLDIAYLVNHLEKGKMEINPMGDNHLEPLLKWLNAVFRAEPSRTMTSWPNSSAFFTRSAENSMPLRSTGGVIEALRGIFQTVQIRFNRLTLNVDTATTAFWVPDKPILEFVCALIGLTSPRGLESWAKENHGRFFQACGKLLGMYFTVKHLSTNQNAKKIKFRTWSERDAVSTKFDEQIDATSTRSTSVVDYYRRKYAIELRYPTLPLASTRFGEFPLELCFSAPGERYREQLQGAETADFIKFATAPAYTRRNQISDNLRSLSWHTQPTIKAHGLSVAPSMMQVKALVLPPPRVIYGSNGTAQPQNGQWNLRGLQLFRPSTVKSWALISFTRSSDRLESLCSGIMKGFRGVGMAVPSRGPSLILGNPQGDIKNIVRNAIAKARNDFSLSPDVIFVLLESPTIPLYKAIKHTLDIIEGVASQIMAGDKALKCQPQYIANVALKVNVKLAGTNSVIDEPLFRNSRWMLIGGDTSQVKPSAAQRDPPVTTALTGTFDPFCTAFTCVASMQPSTRVNVIDNAPLMFKEILSSYREKNRGLMPERVIYFRDGASESEFETIHDQEYIALRELCKNSRTKITVVLAIKRHHTRFFAEGPLATKLGNVPAGTVVENSRSRNDAFIISHGDLQGTKRGTRYISIVDENNLLPDDFNRIINDLCSTYARATRSVAVVPAIYYAHQACERSNIYLQDKDDGSKFLPKVHENLRFKMPFH